MDALWIFGPTQIVSYLKKNPTLASCVRLFRPDFKLAKNIKPRHYTIDYFII